jgi:hypothetical protein
VIEQAVKAQLCPIGISFLYRLGMVLKGKNALAAGPWFRNGTTPAERKKEHDDWSIL